ncbi:MAG: serine/threonine-protein kinase, partial [Isosphaeraceae bacterium]
MSQSDRDERSSTADGITGRGWDDVNEGEVDDYVLAFEEAYQVRGGADPAAFLPPRGHPLHAAVLQELVRVDLEFGWGRGCPRDLDDYHREFPELVEDHEALRAIAYEEYRLRRQAGQDTSASEYRARYGVDLNSLTNQSRAGSPHWPDGDLAEPLEPFPTPGEDFLGFRLERELGRGTFGRVFLARQEDLSDRLVVLKITAARQDEARTLARLQHDNVVPIHSRHRHLGFQAVCMPYLGTVTLREILDDLKAQGGLPGSGRELLSSLDKSVEIKRGACRIDSAHAAPRVWKTAPRRDTLAERGKTAPADSSTPLKGSPDSAVKPDQSDALSVVPAEARARLAGFTYVEAVLWMVSRLADGLAHAHDRGILHLDLKPANVLLTDDGRPLLLDFNLAADLRRDGPDGRPGVGGTLPYMAPEHLRAFLGEDRRSGEVDARSDLYSLGVIAFEMLTGRPPFPIREGTRFEVVRTLIADRQISPPRLRPWNAAVSPAAEAIVRRCLEPDPDRRYPNAGALVEDLERHLAHRPLRHTPEPSVVERAGKWLRRNARTVSVTTALVIGLGAFWGLATLAASRDEARAWKVANEALATFDERALIARNQWNLWARRPQFITATLTQAREALDAFNVLDPRAGDPWWRRPPAATLPPIRRLTLRREVGELFLLLADGERALASGDQRPSRLLDARRANEQAEACFPEGQV